MVMRYTHFNTEQQNFRPTFGSFLNADFILMHVVRTTSNSTFKKHHTSEISSSLMVTGFEKLSLSQLSSVTTKYPLLIETKK